MAETSCRGSRGPGRGDHLDVERLMTDKDAARKGIGGEVLAYVW